MPVRNPSPDKDVHQISDITARPGGIPAGLTLFLTAAASIF